MRELMWLLPALALGTAPPAAQAQFGQPYDPRPGGQHIPSGRDPFGRPVAIPGMPVGHDQLGRPQSPYAGVPGSGFPGVNRVGQSVPPSIDFSPVGLPVNPQREEKDRDRYRGLGVISHLAHLPAPEFRAAPEYKMSPEFRPAAPEFKMPPLASSVERASASEAFSVGRLAERGGGGGLLAGIGGVLASLFRALFGRRKDDRSC